jgi:hypothetical protein
VGDYFDGGLIVRFAGNTGQCQQTKTGGKGSYNRETVSRLNGMHDSSSHNVHW